MSDDALLVRHDAQKCRSEGVRHCVTLKGVTLHDAPPPLGGRAAVVAHGRRSGKAPAVVPSGLTCKDVKKAY